MQQSSYYQTLRGRLLAAKKDGSSSLYVKSRALNVKMNSDRWPLPCLRKVLDELLKFSLLTALKLFSGSWKVKMAEIRKEMTKVICWLSKLKFEVMSFGLMNACAIFQRLMAAIVKDLSFVSFYLNEVVIYCVNIEYHSMHCDKVVSRIPCIGWRLNWLSIFSRGLK